MIGVFDSGVGGLSVLGEIRTALPSADLVYVADQSWAPYGPKSLEEVRGRSIEVGRWLVDQGASTIVMACNTASAAGLQPMRAAMPDLPIVGMEPAVKPAAGLSKSGVVAVFATAATFQGELFESVVNTHASHVETIPIACPEWVELVERGEISGPSVLGTVSGPVSESIEKGADALVLGCTHFSFLAGAIAEAAGDRAAVIDPGAAVAAQTARVAMTAEGTGTTTLLTTGDADHFRNVLGRIGLPGWLPSPLPLRL